MTELWVPMLLMILRDKILRIFLLKLKARVVVKSVVFFHDAVEMNNYLKIERGENWELKNTFESENLHYYDSANGVRKTPYICVSVHMWMRCWKKRYQSSHARQVSVDELWKKNSSSKCTAETFLRY